MSEGNIAADQLRLFIERIERLEEEKKGIGDDIKDVYGEAKANGYDAPTMRKIVKLRKMPMHDRQEAEALLETYKAALGMEDMFAGHDGRSDHILEAEDDAAPQPHASGEGDIYRGALELVIGHQRASTSWLQRQLRIGYNSAARTIEKLERAGIVSRANETGRRSVLVANITDGLALAALEIIEQPTSAEAVH